MIRIWSWVILVMASLMWASCQTTPEVVEVPAPSADKSIDSASLVYELARKTWCTNDEAASLVLLLVDGEDRYRDFTERMTVLESKGLAQPGWNLKAEDRVTKGTLAYMLCRALGIEGGVMMHLLPVRRYAYIEAVHEDLIEQGSEYEPVTGPEAVGIFGRAARMRENM